VEILVTNFPHRVRTGQSAFHRDLTLLTCGLRQHEAVALKLDNLQQREEHWAIVDLIGKGGHIRTVPVPEWVRNELNDWLVAAGIDRGKVFRRVSKVSRYLPGFLCWMHFLATRWGK